MPIKPEWFNGNKDAIDAFRQLCILADVWDNIVDGDKPVSQAEVNNAFLICLFNLPLNPLYRHLETQIAPMWLTVVAAYETANKFEKDKDEHGISLGFSLRHAAGNIISYMMIYCCGMDKAREYIPEMWKNLCPDRYEDYRAEHLGVKGDEP